MIMRPRCLTIKQAAEYAGCRTVAAYRDRVRRGILPGPIPGTRAYDRHAIDAALDRASGIKPSTKELSPYEAWKKQSEGAT
jgi:hypothetical protein